jgi:hypothetical protein
MTPPADGARNTRDAFRRAAHARSLLSARAPLAAAVASAAWAFALFRWGLALPMPHRVRGDAWEYMHLAGEARGALALLADVGPRSAGMPLVDFIVKWAVAPLGGAATAAAWADAVCAVLFATHLLGAASGSALARHSGAVRTRAGGLAVFALIAAFPALVAHTTTPLTDTLNADLVVFALHATELAHKATTRARALSFGASAGFLWAFAALLRPGNLYPAAAAMAVTLAVAALRSRTALPAATASLVVFSVALAPIAARCQSRHGAVCLQSPETFEPLSHVRLGLRGARVLWFHGGYTADGPPTVPDAFLVKHFAEPCGQLQSYVGTDDTSVTGCFARRAHLLPLFALRKWVGLFDHFRFQPYAEPITPNAYRALSRTFDALAWPGFFLGCAAFIRTRAHASATAITGATFVALLVAVHTLLHVEDRYGLAWVPLSLGAFVHTFERALTAPRQSRARAVLRALVFVAVADAFFFATVTRWDATTF